MEQEVCVELVVGTDFAEVRSGERDINPAKLSAVIETFSDPRYRLGLADVQPDFLGRAYEYLLRKFADGQPSPAQIRSYVPGQTRPAFTGSA